MKIGPKIQAWGGLAALLGIIVIFALPSYRHGEASIAGTRAEDFTFQLDGKPAHLSDLRGKVVVLNFWGSWCPPCIEETPELNRCKNTSLRGTAWCWALPPTRILRPTNSF